MGLLFRRLFGEGEGLRRINIEMQVIADGGLQEPWVMRLNMGCLFGSIANPEPDMAGSPGIIDRTNPDFLRQRLVESV